MEFLIAVLVGVLTWAGVYLSMQKRTFALVLGLTLLSYAVNLFLFSMGRLTLGAPAVVKQAGTFTDPLPQALVLTAIVIAFGMTAFLIVLALLGRKTLGTDKVNGGADVK